MAKRKRPFSAYPLRRCNTLHHCAICDKLITVGQYYYDGGYAYRAHRSCVMKQELEMPK